MFAIVALGNPGPQYEFTRHNYGRLAADRIEDRVRITGRKATPSYDLITARHAGRELLLCRPTTYMNRSGLAVSSLVRARGLEPAELLIIYDDIDIDFGLVKLRIGGGDGGHKGLRSIIQELGWAEFMRLRLGIKPDEKPADASDFVLAPFSAAETEQIDELLDRAAGAALQLLTTDVRLVMNSVNRT